MIGIERYAFYERAKQAYAVIQTGERRFYGCVALRKGVIPPRPEHGRENRVVILGRLRRRHRLPRRPGAEDGRDDPRPS